MLGIFCGLFGRTNRWEKREAEAKAKKIICFGLLAACLVSLSSGSCPTDVTGSVSFKLTSVTGDYYLKLETNRPWFFPKKCTVNDYTAEDTIVKLTQNYRYSWFPFSLFALSKSYNVGTASGPGALEQTQTSGWFKSTTEYSVLASTSDYMVLYTCSSGILGTSEKVLVFSPSNSDLSDSDVTSIKSTLSNLTLSTDLETHPQNC